MCAVFVCFCNWRKCVFFAMVMCELRCELGGGGGGGREGGKVVVAEYWISVAIPTHPTCLWHQLEIGRNRFQFSTIKSQTCSSCWTKVWKSRGPLLDYLSSHWSMRAIALYVLRLYIRDAHSDLPVSGVFVSSTVRIMYKERGMGHAGPMSKLPKYCSPQSRLRTTWSIGSDVNPYLPKMAKKWQIMFCY